MKKQRFEFVVRNAPLSTIIALALIIMTTVSEIGTVSAQTADPWSVGDKIRSALFSAQKDMLADKPESVTQRIQAAQQFYQNAMATMIAQASPEIDQRIAQIFNELLIVPPDGILLAYERSYLWTLLLRGSREVVMAAIRRGDNTTAQSWLLLREFRTTTRYMRPDADATVALRTFLNGKRNAEETTKAIDSDLLDAYQTLMIEAMGDAESARDKNFTTKVAEQTGLVVGYFEILQGEFVAQRGQDALAPIQQYTEALKFAAMTSDGTKVDNTLAQLRSSLRTFQAVPLPGNEQALRIQQIDNQMGLATLDYARAIRDGKIIVDFEYYEALTLNQTTLMAFSDIEPLLVARDIKSADNLLTLIKKMGSQMRDRETPEAVSVTANAAKAALKVAAPSDFVQRISNSSDRDIIAVFLNQVETSVAVGDYAMAETARVHAYQLATARLNTRLLSTLPDLTNEIEGLFWQGLTDQAGLAALISSRAPADQINAVIATLNARLTEADDVLSSTPTLKLWFIPALVGAVLSLLIRFVGRSARLHSLSRILLAISLCIVVGAVIHVLQGSGALPITALYGFNLPMWVGHWFGLYPTLQGTMTQLALIGLMYIAMLLPQRSKGSIP